MANQHLPPYRVAQGPGALMSTLEALWQKTQHTPLIDSEMHYILYELGDQKSFIKIDMSKKPYHIWYNDVLGRPITYQVKTVLTTFLANKCGVVFNSTKGVE